MYLQQTAGKAAGCSGVRASRWKLAPPADRPPETGNRQPQRYGAMYSATVTGREVMPNRAAAASGPSTYLGSFVVAK